MKKLKNIFQKSNNFISRCVQPFTHHRTARSHCPGGAEGGWPNLICSFRRGSSLVKAVGNAGAARGRGASDAHSLGVVRGLLLTAIL